MNITSKWPKKTETLVDTKNERECQERNIKCSVVYFKFT